MYSFFSKLNQIKLNERNERVSCNAIPKMDLSAWMEKPVESDGSSAVGLDSSAISFKSTILTTELESRSDNTETDSGSWMPKSEPEGDWVEELPRPIIANKQSMSMELRTYVGYDEFKS